MNKQRFIVPTSPTSNSIYCADPFSTHERSSALAPGLRRPEAMCSSEIRGREYGAFMEHCGR